MEIQFRNAGLEDLPVIIRMLADDHLGMGREVTSDTSEQINERYLKAFRAIETDDNNELIVMESQGEILGTLQLTFIPSLTRGGALRAQIEGVRINRQYRGRGLGNNLVEWAIDHSRHRGAKLVQLTSDKLRPEAIRFYESIGFTASHEGMKMNVLD